MCDSGLVLVVILTSFFVMWAFAAVFYSFDYNCNDFTGDNMVKLYFLFMLDWFYLAENIVVHFSFYCIFVVAEQLCIWPCLSVCLSVCQFGLVTQSVAYSSKGTYQKSNKQHFQFCFDMHRFIF